MSELDNLRAEMVKVFILTAQNMEAMAELLTQMALTLGHKDGCGSVTLTK